MRNLNPASASFSFLMVGKNPLHFLLLCPYWVDLPLLHVYLMTATRNRKLKEVFPVGTQTTIKILSCEGLERYLALPVFLQEKNLTIQAE